MDIREYIDSITRQLETLKSVGDIEITLGIARRGDRLLVVEDSPTKITFTISRLAPSPTALDMMKMMEENDG